MNADVIKGKWNEFSGKAKAKWSKLTDNDFKSLEGRVEELGGILQQKYGYKKDEADRKVDEFMKTFH